MTDRRERATRIQTATAQKVEKIRADPALTALGKQQALAKVWWAAQQQLVSLGQGELDDAKAEMSAVEHRVFGIPPYAGADTVLAARDAAARVDALPKAELDAAYRRAQRRGDTVLVKAIIGRAIDEGVRSVTADAAAQDPKLAEDLAQLERLSDVVGGGSFTDRMQRSMTYSLPAPKEVAGMGQRRIQALAEADVEPAGDAA